MLRLRLGLLAGAALAVALGFAAPASADHDWHGDWHGGGWHDHDIHHFHDHDFDAWRGGHWYHGWHDGRAGWWWMVGPNWYYYPRAVYPYPDPYVPPYVAAPAPGATVWYYCPPAQSYYPYVPSCPVPWQVVPAR